MRRLAFGIIGTLILALVFAVALLPRPAKAQGADAKAQSADAKKPDPTVQLFENAFYDSLKAAGKDFGKCEFTLVDAEPDGPVRVIGVACEKGPYICVFAVKPDETNTGVLVRPLDCLPNPGYDDTPKTNI